MATKPAGKSTAKSKPAATATTTASKTVKPASAKSATATPVVKTTAVKPAVTVDAKPAAKSSAPASAKKTAAAPVVKPANKPAVVTDKPKTPKVKMERDSFTMPKDEYAQIATLKKRLEGLGKPVKKSELLRAGLKLLSGLNDTALKAALVTVPTIKTGRPKK